MPLDEYQRKRRFEETPEPSGKEKRRAAHGKTFVVQKHDATRLHYDFRLEIGEVLASWAVPKGPSLNPADKRLAMRTEDHPLDYATFEGIIPEGNYGAGTVMVWDIGTWEPEGIASAADQLARGEIKFTLHGKKLRGSWVLVRTRSFEPRREQWLLIKHRDDAADPSWDIGQRDFSALTGRSLREIEEGAPPDAASPADLPGAKQAAMPRKIEPMLATLIEKPFSHPDWLFELKWDGMRVLAFVKNGRSELQSRRGRTVSNQFPELKGLADHIENDEAILDGECVVLDEQGRPDFGLMQQRMNVTQPSRALLEEAPIVYYIFDILYCDGYDLRGVPLLARKQFLRSALAPEHRVRYSDSVAEKGEELVQLAKKQHVEGIIGKLSRGRYLAGRSPEWVKLKTTREIDAVVGGFTAPRGSREHFGAILLGLYESAKLHFIGAAGSGFDQKTSDAVWDGMTKLATEECPFAQRPQTREKATWLEPALVARVRYAEWTGDGHLRAPVFLGLRSDIDPRECRVEQQAAEPAEPPAGETPPADTGEIRTVLCGSKTDTVKLDVSGRELRFTNLHKTYFPEGGFSKRHLLCYYLEMAGLILPFLRDRPLVLRRYPDGAGGKMFYQKEVGDTVPDWMTTAAVYSDDARKTVRYAIANDLPSLLFLTNLGCIDHNPWSSRTDDLEHPDYIFFDLDPTPGTPFSIVSEVGKAVYDVLHSIGLKAYIKTSGSTGLHLFLPVERVYTYAQARAFTEIVMRVAASRVPDQTTFERIVEKRPAGRVLLDFSQFSYSRPLASVYSVRPEQAASVSAPIAPEELKRALKPERFTLETMPARLKKMGDLWSDFWQSRQRIEPALERLRTELAPARQVSRS